MPHARRTLTRYYRTALSIGVALAVFALVAVPAVAKCPQSCKKQIKTGLRDCERVCPKGKTGSFCRKTCKAFKRSAVAACASASVAGEPRPASPTGTTCELNQCQGTCAAQTDCQFGIPCTDNRCCSPAGGRCFTLSPCCCPGLSCSAIAASSVGTCVPASTTTTISVSTTTTTLGSGATCANGGLACDAACGAACGGFCAGPANSSGCSATHCGSSQPVCIGMFVSGATCTTDDSQCPAGSACVGNATAPCGSAFCYQKCLE
jgi:hypothetical protein